MSLIHSPVPDRFGLATLLPAVLVFLSACNSLEQCGEATNFDGSWRSTSVCNDNRTGLPVLAIRDISIVQSEDGGIAVLSDNKGASYTGMVCGANLIFTGGLSGEYQEGGIISSTGATSALRLSYSQGLEDEAQSANCSGLMNRL